MGVFAHDTIFNNHQQFFYKSDPQPGWLFEITFESEISGASELIKDIIPISITLPTYETITVERWFLGTSKSASINRKYSGDTDMEFYIRTEHEDDQQLFNLLAKTTQKQNGYKHNEFDETYNKIVIKMVDKKGQSTVQYTYYNTIITGFNMGDMSYEGEDMVKCTLSFHYDFWTQNTEG